MRFSSSGLAMLLVLAGGQQAYASRFYCAVDDGTVKMSIESAYSDRDGDELVHFRGIALLKDETLPAVIREVRLTSDALTQSWADDKSLRMRMYTEKQELKGYGAMDLMLEAGAEGQANGMLRGSYAVTVEWGKTPYADGRQNVKYNGNLACKYQ